MGRVNGRIMVVTTGSFGDVNPFVGLALELQARGHRPVIVPAPFWRQWIEEAGVEYETFESGWDIPSENPAQCLETRPRWQSRVGELSRTGTPCSDAVLVSLTMMGLGPIMAAPPQDLPRAIRP
jgi:Glycosyltransferase family 28 N-terminal domain